MKKVIFIIVSLQIILSSCSWYKPEETSVDASKSIGGQSSGLISNSGSNAE